MSVSYAGSHRWGARHRDVDALLALKPDCVVYNPMFADVDELVRILGAGINVVTTSEFITGHQLGPDRDRIAEACVRAVRPSSAAASTLASFSSSRSSRPESRTGSIGYR